MRKGRSGCERRKGEDVKKGKRGCEEGKGRRDDGKGQKFKITLPGKNMNISFCLGCVFHQS